MDPWLIPRAIVLFYSAVYRFWVRLIGRKWLLVLCAGGVVLAVWLNYHY